MPRQYCEGQVHGERLHPVQPPNRCARPSAVRQLPQGALRTPIHENWHSPFETAADDVRQVDGGEPERYRLEEVRVFRQLFGVVVSLFGTTSLDDGALEVRSRYVLSWAATVGLIILWTFPVGFVGTLSSIDGLCSKVSCVSCFSGVFWLLRITLYPK